MLLIVYKKVCFLKKNNISTNKRFASFEVIDLLTFLPMGITNHDTSSTPCTKFKLLSLNIMCITKNIQKSLYDQMKFFSQIELYKEYYH